MVVKRAVFIAATALAVALPPAVATALIQPEIGATACSLFLNDIDTSPADYNLYRSFVQGYLAAKAAANQPGDDALMSSLVAYCPGHAKQDFAAAIAAVLKK